MIKQEKKLMILGAGVNQVPLIQTAQRRGYSVIVVSPSGNYPGINLAENWLDCDTRNENEILNAARRAKIDGILTTGTDVAVPSIGLVNEKLGLIGVDFDTAQKCQNKINMKKSMVEGGVSTAEFDIISTIDQSQEFIKFNGYPVILKAPDTSGSRGVQKVNSENELQSAFEFAKKYTNSKNLIIEKFLDGYELGAQVIVSDGQVKALFLHNDVVAGTAVSVPIGHSIPVDLSLGMQEKIFKQILRLVNCMQIDNSIINLDLMICGSEIYVIEVGARLGATCIPENIMASYGVDLYEIAIDLALGKSVDIGVIELKTASAVRILRAQKSGVIKRINVENEVLAHPDLIELKFDVGPGSVVNEFKTGDHRIGQIVVKGSSKDYSEQLITDLLKKIEISIDG